MEIISNRKLLKILKPTKKIKRLHEIRGKETMFKSKMKWVEQGEKPTKYFHNLEKNKLWGKIGQRGETRKWRENPAQVNEEIEVFLHENVHH